MDVGFVFNNDAAHARHVRINPVPAAHAGVVPDDRIGLDHIIIPDHGIVADDGVGPDEVPFPETGVLVNARRLVDQFDELPAPRDDRLHAGTPGGAPDRRDENIAGLRPVLPDRPEDRRIVLQSVQGVKIVVEESLDGKFLSVRGGFLS